MNETAANHTKVPDYCQFHACFNNGQCFIIDPNSGQAACQCPQEFTGKFCELTARKTFICSQLGLCKPFGPYIFGVGITTFLCSAVILVYFIMRCCYSFCQPLQNQTSSILVNNAANTQKVVDSHRLKQSGTPLNQQYGRRFVPAQIRAVPTSHASSSRTCLRAIQRRQKRLIAVKYGAIRPAPLKREMSGVANHISYDPSFGTPTPLNGIRNGIFEQNAGGQWGFTRSQFRRAITRPIILRPSEKPYSNETSSETESGQTPTSNRPTTQAISTSIKYLQMQPTISYANNISDFGFSNLSYCSQRANGSNCGLVLHPPFVLPSHTTGFNWPPVISHNPSPCLRTKPDDFVSNQCHCLKQSEKTAHSMLINKHMPLQHSLCARHIAHQITSGQVNGFKPPVVDHSHRDDGEAYENFAML
ncbi:EGF-like domain protein, partial [Opisthorchis viverrini]